MHFKKILSASILASALIFCIPQAIYAAPDAKTETPVTYGWNSDALGRFFLTENGSRATGFCSIDQKVYYFDPDGYLFTPPRKVSCTSHKNLIISLRTVYKNRSFLHKIRKWYLLVLCRSQLSSVYKPYHYPWRQNLLFRSQRKITSKGTSGFKWKKISDQCFRNRKDWPSEI